MPPTTAISEMPSMSTCWCACTPPMPLAASLLPKAALATEDAWPPPRLTGAGHEPPPRAGGSPVDGPGSIAMSFPTA